MMTHNAARHIAALVILTLLASCSSSRVKDGPPRSGSAAIHRLPDDPIPRPEPRSRHGNGPVYEVLGKRYRVMNSASGYRERGVASWYGKKFHGRDTSMGETYDMYEMTAAHKTLPLPTYVRVRNLRNSKSVIVRVNDRGPFVNNRIIDLSYSAALKLDMVGTGTSLVEVEAITFDAPKGDRHTRQVTPPTQEAPVPAVSKPVQVYAQMGAFGSRENADRRIALLRSGGIGTGFVLEDTSSSQTLYRVRLGPIASVQWADMLLEEVTAEGHPQARIVVD